MKFVLAISLILMAAGPAFPENRDLQLLQKDVIDLKQEVKLIQTMLDQNNAYTKGLIEKMADQINTVAGATQKLNQSLDGVKGQNDTSSKTMQQILTNLNSAISDLQESMSSVRAQVNSLSQQMTAMKSASQQQPLEGPNELWRTATLDSVSGSYDLVVADVQDFLSKYPNDTRAPDAHLLLADALANLKKFDQALQEYDIVLQKFPDSDKTRAALLKKGYALAETNQLPQAKATLNEVVSKFPGTSEANSATAKLRELQPPPAARKPPAR
jgi:tol-pal system protein YbgF